METETDQISDSSTQDVQASSETADTGVETSSGSESTDTDTDVESDVEETPKYVPDYKLKVYDEEKELDDPFLKNLIKDADSEKKVKEIAQKYLGFDTLKSKNERTRAELQHFQQSMQPVIQTYNEASNCLAKKDFDGLFEVLQIPTDEIFKYAIKKAEEAQMPEYQRQQMHQQRQIEKEREMLQGQNQSLQQQQYNQLSQFRAQELSWVMQRPEVTSVAQAFDAKNGQGSFRQAVVNQGLAHYAATGQDLSAEQAAMAVVKTLGGFVTQTPLNGQSSTQTIPLIKQSEKPPIIPNVTGRGTSPVKKQVRSIADLKRRSAEFNGN